jgi:hypothetical protein
MAKVALDASASDAPGEAAAKEGDAGRPKKPRYSDTSAEFYVVFRGDDGMKVATAQSLLNAETREKSPFELPVQAIDTSQFKIRYADGEPMSFRATLTTIKRRVQNTQLEYLKESLP